MSAIEVNSSELQKIEGRKYNNAGLDAFSGLGDALSDLMDDSEHTFAYLHKDDIIVKKQVREEFEDEDNSLEDLAGSIKRINLIQPILVRPVNGGYELVAGERRFRASLLAGLIKIASIIRALTDEQVEEIQLAENIQRKNLTQIEIAKRLAHKLEHKHGGDVEALCEELNKSRSWVSKFIHLVDLTPQAARLVSQDISADLEVIHTVRQIEKVDPGAAKALVDELKDTRGKKGENARDKAKAVKDAVKPKKPKKEKDNGNGGSTIELAEQQSDKVGTEEENQSLDFGVETAVINAKSQPSPLVIAGSIYNRMFSGASAHGVLNDLSTIEHDTFEEWLHTYYSAGEQCESLGNGVIGGFRNGSFSDEGYGALALVAFLCGSDSNAQFNVINIIGSVKS